MGLGFGLRIGLGLGLVRVRVGQGQGQWPLLCPPVADLTKARWVELVALKCCSAHISLQLPTSSGGLAGVNVEATALASWPSRRVAWSGVGVGLRVGVRVRVRVRIRVGLRVGLGVWVGLGLG